MSELEHDLLPMANPVEGRLWIDSVISSGHYLPYVGDSHRCRKPHGHDFRVRIWASGYVTSELVVDVSGREQIGMVVDYDRILQIWEPLQAQLDHRVLNSILKNPTCENIAIWILQNTPRWIVQVEISTLMPSGASAGCSMPRHRSRGDGYGGYNVPAGSAESLPADEVL